MQTSKFTPCGHLFTQVKFNSPPRGLYGHFEISCATSLYDTVILFSCYEGNYKCKLVNSRPQSPVLLFLSPKFYSPPDKDMNHFENTKGLSNSYTFK